MPTASPIGASQCERCAASLRVPCLRACGVSVRACAGALVCVCTSRVEPTSGSRGRVQPRANERCARPRAPFARAAQTAAARARACTPMRRPAPLRPDPPFPSPRLHACMPCHAATRSPVAFPVCPTPDRRPAAAPAASTCKRARARARARTNTNTHSRARMHAMPAGTRRGDFFRCGGPRPT